VVRSFFRQSLNQIHRVLGRLHILGSTFENSAPFVPLPLGGQTGGRVGCSGGQRNPREPLGVEMVGSSCGFGHQAGEVELSEVPCHRRCCTVSRCYRFA
jgi:hypothetical protein